MHFSANETECVCYLRALSSADKIALVTDDEWPWGISGLIMTREY